MEFTTPNIDATYSQYVGLLEAQHHSLVDGAKHDEHLESAEDAMTELWPRFDPPQRASLSGISSDLNWVRRGGKLPPKGRRREEVTNVEMAKLAAAKKAGDYHALLHYLRICSPALEPMEIAELRSVAYAALEFPELADLFRAFTTELKKVRGKIAV